MKYVLLSSNPSKIKEFKAILGDSTKKEIEHALNLKKVVRYLEK